MVNFVKKTKKILIGLAVVISLLITLPFLISVQIYLNKIESMASENLGVPVTIATGYLLLLPSLRVIASEITIGKNQEFKVERLVVIPRLSSLFSTTKAIDLKVSTPKLSKPKQSIRWCSGGCGKA